MPSLRKPNGRREPRSRSSLCHAASTASSGRIAVPKRRNSSRPAASSAASKRQQTITQMDPFYSIYHPDDDQENLFHEADARDTYETPNQRSKRQKISANKTAIRRIATLSPRATGSKTAPQLRRTAQSVEKPVQQDRIAYCEGHWASKQMPHPPQTPTARKRTEVPSSQSPADTPLSSYSRNFTRGSSRSPLRERATNIESIQKSSPSKVISSIGVREVPDSMESHEEGLGIPFKIHTDLEKPRKTAEEIYEDLLAQPTPVAPSPEIAVVESPLVKSAEVPDTGGTKQVTSPGVARHFHTRTEILDSDLEEEGEDTSFVDEADLVKSEATTPDPHQDTSAAKPSTYTISSSVSEENLSPTYPPAAKAAQRPTPSVDVPSSQPAHPSPPPKTTQDLASDQLHHELSLYTQGRGATSLITESQYEDGWESYHVPFAPSSIPPPSSPPLQPRLSPTPPEPEMQPTMTVPLQLLPQTEVVATTTTPPPRLPVPSSQATTVDSTQPSTSQHPTQQAEIQQAILAGSSSSPPPPPVPPALSSSPVIARKGTNEQQGYQWDGRVLTDSQLLPASLMEDSLDMCRPLGTYMYEELEEEEII